MGRLFNLPGPLPSFRIYMTRNRANAVHAITRAGRSFRTTLDMRLSLESALATAAYTYNLAVMSTVEALFVRI